MVRFLILITALGLIIQAFIGLSFLISCIREREGRATIFAGLQLLGMTALLVIYLLLAWRGFFKTTPGLVLIIVGYAVAGLAAVFLVRRTAANKKALLGTKGSMVGEVKRFDERLQVFARNRALRPGSEQYQRFYKEHPELEEYDAQRREKGGPLGQIGLVDRPGECPNVAATLASLSIPLNLSHPQIVKPQPHPELRGKSVNLTPEEATTRVKGYARNVGADLVGIAEINPLWVYSHRGEIFHENWDDWGKEIPADHKYAVVVAEEMSLDMIGAAPHTPSVMESVKKYARQVFSVMDDIFYRKKPKPKAAPKWAQYS